MLNILHKDVHLPVKALKRLSAVRDPASLAGALRAKGVDDSVIETELDRHAGQWTELAAEWLQRQHRGPLDFDARKKFYRRLVNRGFTHDQAMDALNRR